MVEQDIAGFGQENLLADPVKQLRTANILQLLDLQLNRRVRQMQLLGGASKGQMRCGDGEYLELPDGCASHD